MAITLIVGVSGSGKSYYTVKMIVEMYTLALKKVGFFLQWFYYYFPLKPKKVYSKTFTNIADFDFSFSPHIHPLDMNELKLKLIVLEMMYLNNEGEQAIITRSQELGIYGCFFAIDEAQNYFREVDKTYIWWFMYQRHLHQQIHLITQVPKNIHEKYTGNITVFYKVFSPKKAASVKTLKLGSYSCKDYYKNCFENFFFVPIDPNIFKLYHSGNIEERVNILKKYYYIIPFFVFLLFIIFYFLMDAFTGDSHNSVKPVNAPTRQLSSVVNISPLVEPVNVPAVSQPSDSSVRRSSNVFKNKKLIFIDCISSECTYNDFSFPISYLLFYIKNTKIKYFNIDQQSTNYTRYSLLVSDSFVNTLKKRKPDAPGKAPNLNPFTSK
ncbi:zonular occludens toxin domain-containing protein [Sulfurovum sp.]|uniref:zonular occludens toxin domain-containing protein n=1 Tax=Sulfurovum sp. TaxID=1969726 RepID=UPI003567B99C